MKIQRNCDQSSSERDWLDKLDKALNKDLEKTAVQSKSVDDTLFGQMSYLMNGKKSKYSSVEEAVKEMQERSGLTAYLKNIKLASEGSDLKCVMFKNHPQAKITLENIVKDSKGNLPIPAILDKLKSIHKHDISDAKDWDDTSLLHDISYLNLKEKSNNPSNNEIFNNLGLSDKSDSIDESNLDMFIALSPTKI